MQLEILRLTRLNLNDKNVYYLFKTKNCLKTTIFFLKLDCKLLLVQYNYFKFL